MDMEEVDIISIEAVWQAQALLGEGPIYDPRCKCILWLDIKGEKLFRLDLKTQAQEVWTVPGNLSALGLSCEGEYICVLRNGFHHLSFTPDPHLTFIVNPESDVSGNRFNDGAVDPFGGFWAGTMDDKENDTTAGRWWRLGTQGEVQAVEKGFHVTNGPVFDPERGQVYYTDSARQIIYRASLHSDGTISEKTTFVTFSTDDGYPDGMAIDSDGVLWVAFWDGACLRRISPKGDILQKIEMPVPRPTKVAIADDGLYVSSASIGLDEDSLRTAPLSGSLFHIKLLEPVKTWHHFYGANKL